MGEGESRKEVEEEEEKEVKGNDGERIINFNKQK